MLAKRLHLLAGCLFFPYGHVSSEFDGKALNPVQVHVENGPKTSAQAGRVQQSFPTESVQVVHPPPIQHQSHSALTAPVQSAQAMPITLTVPLKHS